jgi:Uma2 family endonuclease
MATVPTGRQPDKVEYPTSDGRPMAETDWHRDLMLALIQTLATYYADRPRVYVSGNILVFYEEGNPRRHLSPDVLVVKGVAKRSRPNYLIWQEGKAPQVVIELTSSSTRKEDTDHKFRLYQDTLRVKEYFLFDPLGDYLKPPLQGYRLYKGQYAAIRPADGRLPSNVLGLHLERHGQELRLYNPETGHWVPTAEERAREAAERAREADERAKEADERANQAEAEVERLRRALEALRRSK